jgi:hypothetical protein
MTTLIRALLVASSLGLAPALAAEGNGEPFPSHAGALAALSVPRVADTGSAAYPDPAGRPGSDLPRLAGDVLPATGSEGLVQTANSLPRHFEEGTVAYAQASRVHSWMLAHAGRPALAYASAAPRR